MKTKTNTKKKAKITNGKSTSRIKKVKTKNGFILDNDDINIHSTKYDTVVAEDEINNKMGIFGFNINLERSLPNVRDGLKPTQRKIAYTGFSNNFNSTKPFRKCLRYIGLGSAFYVHGKQNI